MVRFEVLNGDKYEDYDLLAWIDVQFGDSPIFRRKISPPSSKSKCKRKQETNRSRSQNIRKYPTYGCFLFGLFFKPADGGHILFRNDGRSPKYTAYITEGHNPQFKINLC